MKDTPGEPCWGHLLYDMVGYTDEGDETWIRMCEGHRHTWNDGQYAPRPTNEAE